MTRTELHAKALHWAAGMARRRGRCLDGALVKVGTRKLAPHMVTVRGKRYHYAYRKLAWNLHHHNKVLEHLPRLWVLVEWAKRPKAWVVPRAVLGRVKTVNRHESVLGKPCHGKVEPWAGRWDLLKPSVRHG